MILVTGATGNVGRPLVRRLAASGIPVRALVREPRRLGDDRVLAAVAIGDLADPRSLRAAVRGVDTVVHLAAAIRDQPNGTIERINGLATYELLQAAADAGVKRFIYFSALGASERSPSRFMRAKALAEQAVECSPLQTVTIRPSVMISVGDHWVQLLLRMATGPVMPISGRGRAVFQPLAAEDAASGVVNLLTREGLWPKEEKGGFDFAGPQTLTHADLVRRILRANGVNRMLLPVPLGAVKHALRFVERVNGPDAFATWDEAQLLEISMVSPGGTAGLESVQVTPRSIDDVLVQAGAQ